MALLVCPDCGGNVSSKAAKCPRCGCPVSVMIQEQPNSENQQNTEQQSVEQSIQEQPQPVEIVKNEEKNIEEQPKVSDRKEEKVAEPSIRQKSAKEKTNNIIVAVAIIILFGIYHYIQICKYLIISSLHLKEIYNLKCSYFSFFLNN